MWGPGAQVGRQLSMLRAVTHAPARLHGVGSGCLPLVSTWEGTGGCQRGLLITRNWTMLQGQGHPQGWSPGSPGLVSSDLTAGVQRGHGHRPWAAHTSCPTGVVVEASFLAQAFCLSRPSVTQQISTAQQRPLRQACGCCHQSRCHPGGLCVSV